jgi:putative endonuclease
LAAEYLLGKGYTLVTRRFKSRRGEIDIIALDGDVLVFVEVKYRSGKWEKPEATLTDQKRQRFLSAAEEYFQKMDSPLLYSRFDLIAIDQDGLRHYPAAFGG